MKTDGPTQFAPVVEEAQVKATEARLTAARDALSRSPSDKELRKAFQTALSRCVEAAHLRNVLWSEFEEAVGREAVRIHEATVAKGYT